MTFRIYCQQCGEDLQENSSEPIFARTDKRDSAGHMLYELDTSRYFCGCAADDKYGEYWAIENVVEPLLEVIRGCPMREHVTIYLIPDPSVGLRAFRPGWRQMGYSSESLLPVTWRKYLEHFLKSSVLPGDPGDRSH